MTVRLAARSGEPARRPAFDLVGERFGSQVNAESALVAGIG